MVLFSVTVLAVELFAFNTDAGEDIAVNELAMRP